jgi:hypothetical protein
MQNNNAVGVLLVWMSYEGGGGSLTDSDLLWRCEAGSQLHSAAGACTWQKIHKQQLLAQAQWPIAGITFVSIEQATSV